MPCVALEQRGQPGARRATRQMDSASDTNNRHERRALACRALLARPRLPLLVPLVAMLLVLPSLGVGFILDDYLHQHTLGLPGQIASLKHATMELFRFLDGDSQHVQELMDDGLLPWWTHPEIKAAFWRPLAAATHWLDYSLWPQKPVLMHVQSVLWFGGAVLAVALLYRRLLGVTWLAGAAALCYAVDDGHAMPVAWLANRNVILATLFGALAILAHDRWRRDGWRGGALLGPVLFALSLLSAEAGIAACGYLAAHALFLDRGKLWRRGLVLLPYVAIVVVWRLAWARLGFGTAHMGLYTDPLAEPAAFGIGLLQRGPILLMGSLAFPPADIAAILPDRAQPWLVVAAVGFVVFAIVLLVPLIRRDRLARFWALGMVLAAIPACATKPTDRLLFFVGIGALGLVAQFLNVAFGWADWRPHSSFGRKVWRQAALGLVFVHLIIAPIGLLIRSAMPFGPPRLLDMLMIHTPLDEQVDDQDVIVVNAPSVMHVGYLPVLRGLAGQPVPRHVRALAPGLPAVEITRTDDRTLVIRPEGGYLAKPIDRLLRDERAPLRLGEQVKLTGVTIEVTALTDDGRPAEATFHFAAPLEDSSLRWLRWDDGEFQAFEPPPIGGDIELRPTFPSVWRRGS